MIAADRRDHQDGVGLLLVELAVRDIFRCDALLRHRPLELPQHRIAAQKIKAVPTTQARKSIQRHAEGVLPPGGIC